MTDTPRRDELILAHRIWIGATLKLELHVAHAFLESCTDGELETIASLQGVADKRTKRDAIKTIYNAASERGMTRQPEPPTPAPTPDHEAPAAETQDPEAPAVEVPAAEQTNKPTRRKVTPGS